MTGAALWAAVWVLAQGPAIIEDDYPRALAAARAGGKMLFVEAWAPWCHTCVFMREHVLNQPEFKVFEKDVVFAAIDTEKPGNAAFLEKFPNRVWPTLWFINAGAESVALQWAGSVNARQMKALIAAARAPAGGRTGGAAEPAHALLGRLAAHYLAGEHEACARLAAARAGALSDPQDHAGAVTWGLGSVLELPASPPALAWREHLVALARKDLAREGILADDKSGLYDTLVYERELAGDTAGAKNLAVAWLAFLEGEAARAPAAAARAVFDSHRAAAAIKAGDPARAIPALLESEAALPSDYNPPSRLALLYLEQGNLGAAAAAARRALDKCQAGPRKLRIFHTLARVLEKQGDAAGLRETVAAALAYAATLPEAQRAPKLAQALSAMLPKP